MQSIDRSSSEFEELLKLGRARRGRLIHSSSSEIEELLKQFVLEACHSVNRSSSEFEELLKLAAAGGSGMRIAAPLNLRSY